jgi:quinol monooxygenase YgiN
MPVTYIVRMHAVEGREAEVESILLENVTRIRNGEPGNLAFAVHRSLNDPGEFWLYETWVDEAAVALHESGAEFASYKERIRPLTHSVLFGNCEPIQAVGYSLTDPAGDPTATLPERFVRALGTNDSALLDDIYDPDVLLYTPLGWPIRGRAAVKEFVQQFHSGYPGLRVTLHDRFASPDGIRLCFRFVIHFENTGSFYGHEPTGQRGTMSETHAVRLRDGRIVEQFVGDNNFSIPHQELVTWRMEFPRDTPDPNPVLAEGAAGDR